MLTKPLGIRLCIHGENLYSHVSIHMYIFLLQPRGRQYRLFDQRRQNFHYHSHFTPFHLHPILSLQNTFHKKPVEHLFKPMQKENLLQAIQKTHNI